VQETECRMPVRLTLAEGRLSSGSRLRTDEASHAKQTQLSAFLGCKRRLCGTTKPNEPNWLGAVTGYCVTYGFGIPSWRRLG